MSAVEQPHLKIACMTSADDELMYAVLEVDRDFVTATVKKTGFAEMCKKYDERFYRCAFFDYAVRYFADLDIESLDVDEDACNALQCGLEDCEWILLPPARKYPEDGEGRCESLTANYDEESVIWSCIPKYANTPLPVETQYLGIDFLVSLLGQLQQPLGDREHRTIQID